MPVRNRSVTTLTAAFHLTFFELQLASSDLRLAYDLILSSDLLPTFNQLPWFEFETFLIIGREFNELLLLSLMKLGCLLGYSTNI